MTLRHKFLPLCLNDARTHDSKAMPKGVVSDIKGSFSGYKSSKENPEELRKVVVLDPDHGTIYIFLTINMKAAPLLISEFYRNRWSIELIFKL